MYLLLGSKELAPYLRVYLSLDSLQAYCIFSQTGVDRCAY